MSTKLQRSNSWGTIMKPRGSIFEGDKPIQSARGVDTGKDLWLVNRTTLTLTPTLTLTLTLTMTLSECCR